MSLFEDIEGFVSGKLAIIQTVFSIIKLETRLAGLSVFPLLINICLLLIVLSTAWITLMCLLGYGLFILLSSTFSAFFGVFLVHLLLLFGLFRYLIFNIRNLSFEKTRAYLANREKGYGNPTKTTANGTQEAGTAIKLPGKEV